jgi:hypothetical protein
MGQTSSSEELMPKEDEIKSRFEIGTEDPNKKKKLFDKSILLTQGFNQVAMGIYPHKSREGEIPKRLLII